MKFFLVTWVVLSCLLFSGVVFAVVHQRAPVGQLATQLATEIAQNERQITAENVKTTCQEIRDQLADTQPAAVVWHCRLVTDQSKNAADPQILAQFAAEDLPGVMVKHSFGLNETDLGGPVYSYLVDTEPKTVFTFSIGYSYPWGKDSY